MNKLQIFKNAGYFELSLQQPLSHGFAVTAPLTQGSLETVHDGLFQQTGDCRYRQSFVIYISLLSVSVTAAAGALPPSARIHCPIRN